MKIFSKVTPMQKNYIPEKVYFLVKLCEIQILKKSLGGIFPENRWRYRKKMFHFFLRYSISLSVTILHFSQKSLFFEKN